MRVTDKHVFFWHGWPGQWYKSPFAGPDGQEYTCAEQWMMAEKARLFGDNERLKKIMETAHPKMQQTHGRLVQNFNEEKWNAAARDIVYRGNVYKFQQHKDLKQLLLDTGDRLMVEASPSDRIWGVGLKEDDPLIDDPVNWKGKNWLGETLTQVRESLKAGLTIK